MVIIKHISCFLVISLSTLLFSCNKNTESDAKIIWITTQLSDNSKTESEWYYYNKDSVKNQQKIIQKNVIDTLNSHFYEFGLIESTDGKKFTGNLKFYSVLDTTKNIINKEVTFSFIQKNKDSIFYTDYKFNKNRNNIVFEYSTFDNKLITGFIREVLTIKTNDKEKVRIIENITLVDNKPNTLNPAIGRVLKNIEK
ncbi:hypothetical protein ACSTS3_16205 [Aquimarina muelleri]|uniref:hypothetical protein n=1 Tax=Aquimarina muelleri TaxID=279356 RepID=UPI003F685C4D